MTSHKSYFQLYTEFADAMSIPRGSINHGVNPPALKLAIRLVTEEYEETVDALAAQMASPSLENLTELADGIADTIYVLCQLARAADIPLDAVFAEVHRSNMAKLQPDGTVKRREDGKVLKPDGWTPPQIWEVLKSYSDSEASKAGTHGAANWS